MSAWEGFDQLDLSGVRSSTGSARLGPGSYLLRATEAKIETPEGTSNKKVVVVFVDEGGAGDITVNFNVFHTSAEAMRIGREQLKGFLEVSGHPTPDNPRDISSLVGLRAAGVVKMGKPWTNREGEKRQNTEVVKWMTPDAPVTGPSPEAPAPTAAAGAGALLPNDTIPF